MKRINKAAKLKIIFTISFALMPFVIGFLLDKSEISCGGPLTSFESGELVTLDCPQSRFHDILSSIASGVRQIPIHPVLLFGLLGWGIGTIKSQRVSK